METLNKILPGLYQTIISVVDTRVSEIKVTREDFNDLKNIVRELAEAQKRTELRVENLAEAQERTELRVEDLAKAQERTELRLTRLEAVVEELAEAQKRTEAGLVRLEAVVKTLVYTQKGIQKELGGLSHTVGYTLEDRGIRYLVPLLKDDLNIEIEGRLERRYIEYPDGRSDEINVLGRGKMNGKQIFIIGESKSQLKKKDIDLLLKKMKRASSVLKGEGLPIAITYSVKPKIEEYATDKGVKVYHSYEFGF